MKAKLGEVPDYSDNSPVPQGVYHVSVEEVELVSKEGKSPYVRTVFVIREGECEGRKLFHNFMWSEKSLPFMKGFLIAIDYDTKGEIDIDYKDWPDSELGVKVSHEMYKGQPKAKIAQYIPLKEAGFKKAGKLDDTTFP